MEPLSTLQHQLHQGSLPRRAWSGAFCAVQGAMLTLRSPSLLSLAVIPVVVQFILYPLSLYGAYRLLGPAHALLFPWAEPEGFWSVIWWLGSWLLYAVLAVVFGLTALLVVAAVAAAVTAPILDNLSGRAEQLFSNTPAPEGPGVAESVVRALRGQVFMLVVYVVALALGGLAYVIPVAGLVLGPMVQALVTIVFMAVQFLEWPAERRRLGVRDRFRLVREHRAACLGFGAAAWLMMIFPFTLPLLAVGGTLLFLGLHPPPTRT